ncbi:hypothetical protein [Marinagarivorans cellulosilyticus]|uniref:hypothetical protein n=1 Tax=Marinagarivorans cellulosilyticus TaxID=2721545 RepID=UPI001F2A3B5E|nr:hypothetical protein [Marinagarivorans cellulosilyticus]
MKLLGTLSALVGFTLLLINWIFLGLATLAAGLWITGLLSLNCRGVGILLIIGSLAFAFHHSFTYWVLSTLLLGVCFVGYSFFSDHDLVDDLTDADNYFDGDSD